ASASPARCQGQRNVERLRRRGAGSEHQEAAWERREEARAKKTERGSRGNRRINRLQEMPSPRRQDARTMRVVLRYERQGRASWGNDVGSDGGRRQGIADEAEEPAMGTRQDVRGPFGPMTNSRSDDGQGIPKPSRIRNQARSAGSRVSRVVREQAGNAECGEQGRPARPTHLHARGDAGTGSRRFDRGEVVGVKIFLD